MKLYCAGPLFSEAERTFLEACVRRFRTAGLDCFLPHEAAAPLERVSVDRIFGLDYEGLVQANALFAWLDGPVVDDGTACEIGMFRGLMERGEIERKGIVGLVTDLRLQRRRPGLEEGGLNLFVAGAIRKAGRICWSLEEALNQLLVWKKELERPASG